MKHIILTLTLIFVPVCGFAQDTDNKDIDEGKSLLEEGARLIFKGLMSEMEPALEDMTKELENLALNAEPMMRELAQIMGDLTNYHPPEILPNGDIIIRRKFPKTLGPNDETDI